MKKYFIVLFFFSFLSGTLSQIFPSQEWSNFDSFDCLDSNYVLVFSDEFNESTIDTNKWYTKYPYYPPEDRSPFKNQIYLDRNVFVKDGKAHILMKEEEYTYMDITKDRTAGVLHTKWEARNRFQYGIFEMRAIVPTGDGFWPAFWMYGWCANEIDIFEFSNNDNLFRTDMHTQVPCGKKHEHDGEKHELPFKVSDDFHVYTLIWTPFKLIWQIDGITYRTVYKYYRKTLLGWKGVDCDEIQLLGNQKVWKSQIFPFYDMDLIISSGFGNPNSGYGNLPIKSEELPAEFIIDYVRVYQNIGVKEIAGNRNLLEGRFYTYNLDADPFPEKVRWTCSDNLFLINGKEIVLVGINNPNQRTGWIKCTFNGKFGPIELMKEVNVIPAAAVASSIRSRLSLFSIP
ncbi:MAG: glycoside hydrolase family 16 protein [Bacteroidota bacterium]